MLRPIRFLPLCLPLLLSACGGPSGPPAGWITYTPKDGGFSIAMPVNPKESKMNAAGNMEFTIAAVEQPDVTYIISFNDTPDAVLKKGPDALFEVVQNGAISNVKGKMVWSKKIALDAHPGREFEFESESSVIARQRFYLVKNRLYGILVVAKGKTLPKEAEAFLASFKLN